MNMQVCKCVCKHPSVSTEYATYVDWFCNPNLRILRTPWVTPCLLWPLFVLLSSLRTNLISGQKMNRSLNWHSFYQKWPLFFPFLANFTHRDPRFSQALLNRALRNTFMGFRLFLGTNPNFQKIVSSISGTNFVKGHLNEPPWKKLEKWCFYMIFCLFLSQNRKTFPLLLKVLTCLKNCLFICKINPRTPLKIGTKALLEAGLTYSM